MWQWLESPLGWGLRLVPSHFLGPQGGGRQEAGGLFPGCGCVLHNQCIWRQTFAFPPTAQCAWQAHIGLALFQSPGIQVGQHGPPEALPGQVHADVKSLLSLAG